MRKILFFLFSLLFCVQIHAFDITGPYATPLNIQRAVLKLGNVTFNEITVTTLNVTTLNIPIVDTANYSLDSDKLDGEHGSFYQDADNINAGTLSLNRLDSNVVTKNYYESISVVGTVDATILRSSTVNISSGFIITESSANLKLVPNGSGITQIGDAGSTSRGLIANDDLFVSGKLEVDGISYFDGAVFDYNSLTVRDDIPFVFGNSSDVQIDWSTGQTNNSLVFGLGNTSKYILLCETNDIAFNFAHSNQADPTIFIHSSNQNTEEWIGFTHDKTDGIIFVGSGNINLTSTVDITQDLFVGAGIGSNGTRVNKGWFTDIDFTNYPMIAGTAFSDQLLRTSDFVTFNN